MNILIIGSGGREHSLAWKIKQSPKVKNIFVAPGNAGTSQIAENIELTSINDILDWVQKNRMDFVVVAPDNYLADGLVDELEKIGIKTFGPTKNASEIEWSKSFAKQFMKEEGIPTAQYEICTDFDRASAYVEKQSFPLVIKASGLALGKGVYIAKNLEEAKFALEEIMQNKVFGDAGVEVVIEEYLEGREISVHAFCDGENAILFPASQDHKRIFENDEGPNTGGMGTIAPVPWVTNKQMQEIKDLVVIPTLQALKRRGRPFKGILFPGIMITENGPKVIEFNARFGDPETQSYMRILESDLVDILLSCVNGTLNKQEIKWSHKSACCIVAASGGYPGNYEKGKVIQGLETVNDKDIMIFHAGTKNIENKIVTNGGRVLNITTTGNNLNEALSKAYKVIDQISFEGMQYRRDIGKKSLNIEN